MPRQHGYALRAVRRSSQELPDSLLELEILGAPNSVVALKKSDDAPRTLLLDPEAESVFRDALRQGLIEGSAIPTDFLKNIQIYDHFFKGLAPAGHDTEMLACLGKAMSQTDWPTGARDSHIPAAYTYLGQFIAHDIGRLAPMNSSGQMTSLRTSALDLDSVFGAIDAGNDALADSARTIGQLPLGSVNTNKSAFRDLPRSVGGEAQIADARNDHNLAVAQTTVAIVRFYWRLYELFGRDEVAAKLSTIVHFQHVVLNDYLRRLVDEAAYTDVTNYGMRFIGLNPFLVPREFSFACFRVGHAMIRRRYEHWSDKFGASVPDLLKHTYRNGFNKLTRIPGSLPKELGVSQDWTVSWNNFNFPAGENNEFPIHARSIDADLDASLSTLDAHLANEILHPDGSHSAPQPHTSMENPEKINLSVQTLLRGKQAGLPDAQTFQAEMANALAGTAGELPAALSKTQISDVGSTSLRGFLEKGPGTCFATSTPLWFYCLRECAVAFADGRVLGPVTSRVVMETIYAAIKMDACGVLNLNDAKKQELLLPVAPNASGQFGWREFVEFAFRK